MSTLIVYSDTTDGIVYSSGSNGEYEYAGPTYADVRAGSSLAASSSGGAESVGQYYSSGSEYLYVDEWGTSGWVLFMYNSIYEFFLSFDTSSIPDTDTVSAAVLNLTSQVDNSLTDFTIEARLYDWGASLTTADWVAGANLSSLTLLAHRDTASGWTAATAYDLTDDAFAANVNKTGSTRLLLCSDHTTSSTAPTGYEYVNAYSADTAGTTYGHQRMTTSLVVRRAS